MIEAYGRTLGTQTSHNGHNCWTHVFLAIIGWVELLPFPMISTCVDCNTMMVNFIFVVNFPFVFCIWYYSCCVPRGNTQWHVYRKLTLAELFWWRYSLVIIDDNNIITRPECVYYCQINRLAASTKITMARSHQCMIIDYTSSSIKRFPKMPYLFKLKWLMHNSNLSSLLGSFKLIHL